MIEEVVFYLHVVHDELEEPSQGAAFLLYTRIHFSTGSEKSSSTSQHANFLPPLPPRKKEKPKIPANFSNTPTEESIKALYLIRCGGSYDTPGAKSTFKKRERGRKGGKTHRRKKKAQVEAETRTLT